MIYLILISCVIWSSYFFSIWNRLSVLVTGIFGHSNHLSIVFLGYPKRDDIKKGESLKPWRFSKFPSLLQINLMPMRLSSPLPSFFSFEIWLVFFYLLVYVKYFVNETIFLMLKFQTSTFFNFFLLQRIPLNILNIYYESIMNVSYQHYTCLLN